METRKENDSRPPSIKPYRRAVLGGFLAMVFAGLLPRAVAIAWITLGVIVIVGIYVLTYRRFTFRRHVDLLVSPARARQLVEEVARAVLGAAGTGPQAADGYHVEAWKSGHIHGVDFRIAPRPGGSRVSITSQPVSGGAAGLLFNPVSVEIRWHDLNRLVARLQGTG